MASKNRIIILLMFLLFVFILIGESKQKHINWFPSYAVKHKIPFGTYIAHREAQKLWHDSIIDVKSSPYVFFKENPDAKGTYLIYNPTVILGKTNLKTLLNWVAEGNSLFISAENFDTDLLDSLNLEIKYFVNDNLEKKLLYRHLRLPIKDTAINDKVALGYVFEDKKLPDYPAFKSLGEFVQKEEDKQRLVNFIKYKWQKGYIYLHSLPFAFTNYAILKNSANQNYFEGLLAYLNLNKPIYWDVHTQIGEEKGYIFQYLLENKAFLWAYRLTFVGLFLYIIFEGKRKQRPIPVILPPKNESLSFTKTIADMYIQHGENKKIAQIHIKHFMDYLRTRLHLDTRKPDKKLIQQIAQKTKSKEKTVTALFELINDIQQVTEIKPEKVLTLEKLINQIKESSINKT